MMILTDIMGICVCVSSVVGNDHSLFVQCSQRTVDSLSRSFTRCRRIRGDRNNQLKHLVRIIFLVSTTCSTCSSRCIPCQQICIARTTTTTTRTHVHSLTHRSKHIECALCCLSPPLYAYLLQYVNHLEKELGKPPMTGILTDQQCMD